MECLQDPFRLLISRHRYDHWQTHANCYALGWLSAAIKPDDLSDHYLDSAQATAHRKMTSRQPTASTQIVVEVRVTGNVCRRFSAHLPTPITSFSGRRLPSGTSLCHSFSKDKLNCYYCPPAGIVVDTLKQLLLVQRLCDLCIRSTRGPVTAAVKIIWFSPKIRSMFPFCFR